MTTAELSFVHRHVPPDGVGMPTILLLHGAGGDEESLLNLAAIVAPTAGLLAPRGKALGDGAPRFFGRLHTGSPDLDDLRERTDDLATFIREAAETYCFDPGETVAVGYANGAEIAASLLLRHPGLLAGAALLHGALPFAPSASAALAGTDVLVTAGRMDATVTAAQTEELAAALRRAGANVELEWQPGGHELTIAEILAAAGWWRERLGIDAP